MKSKSSDFCQMLEDFLNNQTDESEYMKVPPLSKHYTLRWAQEDLMVSSAITVLPVFVVLLLVVYTI